MSNRMYEVVQVAKRMTAALEYSQQPETLSDGETNTKKMKEEGGWKSWYFLPLHMLSDLRKKLH